MSFPPVYNPAVANPNDGELITQCKILDQIASNGVSFVNSTTASVSRPTITSSAQIAGADSTREGVVLFNTGTNLVYVLLGSGTASSTNYSFSLAATDLVTISGYTGVIQAIAASGGSIAVTILS